MRKFILLCGLTVISTFGSAPLLAQTTPIIPLEIFLPVISAEQSSIAKVTATPTLMPTSTSTSTPTSTPTMTPTPEATQVSPYEFNVAELVRCDPQAGGSWFSGKVYKNGEPANGYRVVFSYEADGPLVTQPVISGPHEGYRNWDDGYYSHIISAGRPRAGDWFVWIVNENDTRISEMVSFTTDGDANTCNQAIIDFDSRQL